MSISHRISRRTGVLLTVLLLGAHFPAYAQDISYTPLNPSFGGSPFNSAHLMGIATAQKPEKPKEATAASSQSDLFLRQLQSRLLSSLAGQVTDSIFGDDPQDHGTINFGNQLVSFQRGLTTVVLTVTDLAAGTTTEIEIPLLQN